MVNELSLELALWLSVVSVLIDQCFLLNTDSRLKHNILGVGEHTVPLNYNFTFTRVSTRVTTRGSRGKCQKLPWKASFPRDGPWLFHAKTRGISRHVVFPRDDTWHFHETSRGISTRPVSVESRVDFSRDQ